MGEGTVSKKAYVHFQKIEENFSGYAREQISKLKLYNKIPDQPERERHILHSLTEASHTLIEDLETKMTAAASKSPLPAQPDYDAIDTFVAKINE